MNSLQNTKQTVSRQNSADSTYRQTVVSEAVEEYASDVQTDIRFYLLKFGNSYERQNLPERVAEIWQETVVEALQSAHNFDPTKPARPWLRIIAVRRVQKSWSENKQRGEIFTDAEQTAAVKSRLANGEKLSETETLDLAAAAGAVEKFLRQTPDIEEILSVLPDSDDREILRLRYVENLRGADLAKAVGAASAGAAQKTAVRALHKLREAHQQKVS